jgi:hypothetical protein
MMNPVKRYVPALPKIWLLLIAGLAWSSIGLFLNLTALAWLPPLSNSNTPILLGIGLLLALAIGILGFSLFAKKNIHRIQRLPEKACVFAFQDWTSYPLVAVMITMGIILRNSAIPKTLLAPMYIGIGGGLIIASLHYYRTVSAHMEVKIGE